MNANTAALVVTNPNGHQNLAWASNVISLAPNTSYRFAIGFSNPASATGNLTLGPGSCSLDLVIVNDNPAQPPFDQ